MTINIAVPFHDNGSYGYLLLADRLATFKSNGREIDRHVGKYYFNDRYAAIITGKIRIRDSEEFNSLSDVIDGFLHNDSRISLEGTIFIAERKSPGVELYGVSGSGGLTHLDKMKGDESDRLNIYITGMDGINVVQTPSVPKDLKDTRKMAYMTYDICNHRIGDYEGKDLIVVSDNKIYLLGKKRQVNRFPPLDRLYE